MRVKWYSSIFDSQISVNMKDCSSLILMERVGVMIRIVIG